MNVQTTVKADKAELQRLAREEAYSTPLKDFHPGAPLLFQNDTLWPWFERLRKEEPVHYCTNSPIEPYWSVTKYKDIMHVDTNHGIFSSEVGLGGILIRERAGKVLDALPRNETFNFVDRVSIELTTQMLATLFDFPWEERRKLTRWFD